MRHTARTGSSVVNPPQAAAAFDATTAVRSPGATATGDTASSLPASRRTTRAISSCTSGEDRVPHQAPGRAAPPSRFPTRPRVASQNRLVAGRTCPAFHNAAAREPRNAARGFQSVYAAPSTRSPRNHRNGRHLPVVLRGSRPAPWRNPCGPAGHRGGRHDRADRQQSAPSRPATPPRPTPIPPHEPHQKTRPHRHPARPPNTIHPANRDLRLARRPRQGIYIARDSFMAAG